MVEDRITDGKRIAQLLASGLTGLSSGTVARLAVEEADPDAEPSEGGTYAYRIVRDGDSVGEVFVLESSARIDLDVPVDATEAAGGDSEPDVDTSGLMVTTADDGTLRIRVEYAAAVKRALDLIVAALGSR
jgi:hypothetical protein